MNHCRNSFRHFRVFGHNHFSNGRLIAKLSKIYKKIVSLGKMSQLPTVFQGKPNLRKGFFERHVFSEFRQKMAVFRESFEVFIPRKSTDSSLIHHVSLKLTTWYMRDIFFYLYGQLNMADLLIFTWLESPFYPFALLFLHTSYT